MKLFMPVFVVVATFTASTMADGSSDLFAPCGLMVDNAKRLACYDKAQLEAARQYQAHEKEKNIHSPTGFEKYGITESPTPEEMEKDIKYGGYPNNAYFNNETRCQKVIKLFDELDAGKTPKRMNEFLSFSKMSLAMMDIISAKISNISVYEKIGKSAWTGLPVLYGTYCRKHPVDTLDNATVAVYSAAKNVETEQ